MAFLIVRLRITESLYGPENINRAAQKLFAALVLTLMVDVSLSSCASKATLPPIAAAAMVGRWENRSGGFFRLSWDQCEFFSDQKFSCTSYPLKGDLALSFDGMWSLSNNELQLNIEHDAKYIYYITEAGKNSFTIDSRFSGVRTFYRVKEFN